MFEHERKTPAGPALVLFGIVGVLLIALSGQPRILPAAPPTLTEIIACADGNAAIATVAVDAKPRAEPLFPQPVSPVSFDARGILWSGQNRSRAPSFMA
ncbi:MAG: hypothetical protein U0521_13365 [Anaerolineae bacterium]